MMRLKPSHSAFDPRRWKAARLAPLMIAGLWLAAPCAAQGIDPPSIVPAAQEATPGHADSVDLVASAQTPGEDRPCLVLVVGAAGEDAYAEAFATWAARWKAAAEQSGTTVVEIGAEDVQQEQTDREKLRGTLQELSASSSDAAPVWLVLIGHGTFDGRTAKFNLRGPDVSAEELAQWCQSMKQPLAIINCFSSSAPFIARLSGPNRVVITATKSGFEQNFSRFGDFLSQAIADRSADLDKDQQTSLLEAFIAAAKRTAEFYESEGRLATEQPLLEDNGDGRGVSAEWFRGIRPVAAPREAVAIDGQAARRWLLVKSAEELELSAEQQQRRDALEADIEQLRVDQERLAEEDHLQRLQNIALALARLYDEP